MTTQATHTPRLARREVTAPRHGRRGSAGDAQTIAEAMARLKAKAADSAGGNCRRGTLEVGKLADFAILDQDYFTVPAERLARTVSLLTVVGGKVVHAAAPFASAP